MLSHTDLVYRLSISEMKLIQVLTGDSIDVDINQYINTRDDVKMLDRNEISIDDKEFVRKMKSISSRKKKLRFANRGGGNIVVMVWSNSMYQINSHIISLIWTQKRLDMYRWCEENKSELMMI